MKSITTLAFLAHECWVVSCQSEQGSNPQLFFEDFMPDMEQMQRKIHGAVKKRQANPDISWRELVPHKDDDIWTASDELRHDIEKLFDQPNLKPLRDGTILELGSYVGYTSRFFSYLFNGVIAMDMVPEFLLMNEYLNRDRNNVMTLQLNYQSTSAENEVFKAISRNNIQVAYVDASHDKAMVLRDIARVTMFLPSVQVIVFDDFGAEEGVREAVAVFQERGALRPIAELGRQPPWNLKDGRLVNHTEALACIVPVQDAGNHKWAGGAVGWSEEKVDQFLNSGLWAAR